MATFVNDTFTGTDGTSLASHTGETGATWVQDSSFPLSVGCALATNRVRQTGSTGQSVMHASGTPATPDYQVDADCYVYSVIGTSGTAAGIIGRLQTGTGAVYIFCYDVTAGGWKLQKKTAFASSTTILGTSVQTLTAGQTYHIKMLMVGTTISCYVDGVQVISTTDTDITAAGKAGVIFYYPTTAPSNSTGVHIDNFQATDYIPAAPTNSSAPAISGTAQEGQVVNCSQGTWANSPTSFTYQWKRNGTNISGATTSSYTLSSSDVAQSVTCTVTASNAGGSGSADSASITPIAAVSLPANSVAPVISGIAQDGQILSVSNGTWTNSPTGYTYQWKRTGSSISGATSSTYLIVSADIGQAVKCTVTAVNAGGSASTDSNTVTPTAIPAPTSTTAPVIYGSAQSGQTANCTAGEWTNNPLSYSYQWKKDGSSISGATGSSYSFQTTDESHAITCTVTATNSGGSNSATSNAITVLPAPAPGTLTLPFLTGTAQTGAQLFCSTGTWSGSPATFTYQWRRDGVDISGETTNDHVVVTADEGHSIRCAVTASNASLSATATSNSFVPVPATSVGSVSFIAQLPTSGLSGVVAMQVIESETGNVLVARSADNIDEVIDGSGIYRALRVTEPPIGSIVIWDDGSPSVNHVAVTRY